MFPFDWVCRLQLSFTCYPHIVGVTWVKLNNSLLSACDAGWCVVPSPLLGLCFDNFFLLLLEWAWLMLSSVGGGWFVLLVSPVTVFWTCLWITTLVLLLLYAGYSVPDFSRWGFVCLCWLFGCLVTAPAWGMFMLFVCGILFPFFYCLLNAIWLLLLVHGSLFPLI
jgi:hypothetical protein